MAGKRPSLVIAEILEEALRPFGFARKGVVLLARREPTYWIVRVNSDPRRGTQLILEVTSELESRAKGWPIVDPFRDGLNTWQTIPSLAKPGEFEEYESVRDPAQAAKLAERWSRWILKEGLALLQEGSDTLNERYKA